MNIHNIRLGLATNSSSSHSICIMPNPLKHQRGGLDGENQYGWGDFTLATANDKRKYLATTLYITLKADLSEHVADTILNSLYGEDFISKDAYIDHQSVIGLPMEFDGKAINLDFYKDLEAYITKNENIAILGGNDNSEGHPLRNQAKSELDLPQECAHKELIARKDGNIWVLFNRVTGGKLRFDFGVAA